MKNLSVKDIFLFVLVMVVTAFCYISIVIYISNPALINKTLFTAYPAVYKSIILTNLYVGYFHELTILSVFLSFITAILAGITVSLLLLAVKRLQSAGKIKFVLGGSLLAGLAASGCAVCGIPLLALLGLSGSLVFLPFKGTELSWLVIILLLVSLFIIIKQLRTPIACKKKSFSKRDEHQRA